VSRDITRIPDVRLVAERGATLPGVKQLEALSMSVDSALKLIGAALKGPAAELSAALLRSTAYGVT
jgi:hypothetical protein